MERRITTREELLAWLEENHWFEEDTITSMDPVPDQGPCPRAATLGFRVKSGSWHAGEPCTVRDFELTLECLRRWTLDGGSSFVPGMIQDAVYVLDDVALSLVIEAPGRLLKAEFAALRVDQAPDRLERVEPFTSDGSLSAKVFGVPLPSPATWLDLFRARGLDCAWRYHAGSPTPPERVTLETGGWSLQLTERVARTSDGLTFMTVKASEGGFGIAVDEREAREVWVALGHVLAGFSRVEVRCGNVTFTGPEWLRYLESGEFPERVR